MKKLLSVFLAFCFTILFSICTFAANNSDSIPKAPSDYGSPVHEDSSFHEALDAQITERVYFVPDKPVVSSDKKSGRGWFRNETTINWGNNPASQTTCYAESYFVWGDGDVSVSHPSSGYDWWPSTVRIISEDLDYGVDKYAGVFNKNAYVKYNITYKVPLENAEACNTLIRVSQSGNLI